MAGCASLLDETIEVTDTSFYVKAYCAETNDLKIAYELQFDFWAPVNSEKVKIERLPAGKIHFVIPKQDKPARWL